MNIYIVITRINNELNCLIIMHLSCCLIFRLPYGVLHLFSVKKDSRNIYQSVTKEQMQKKEEILHSIQGHFSSPIIS